MGAFFDIKHSKNTTVFEMMIDEPIDRKSVV